MVVNAELRNWNLVKEETDQAGVYGRGEVSLGLKTREAPLKIWRAC